MRYSVLNVFGRSDEWCYKLFGDTSFYNNFYSTERILMKRYLSFDNIIQEMIDSGNNADSGKGRDLVRLLCMEYSFNIQCYSASLEKSSIDSKRHSQANFNQRDFCTNIKKKYKDLKFKETTLDYMRSPLEWQRENWKDGFFHSTLPNFWYEGLLEKNGGIYIPFTLHCFQQVLRHYECLRKVYCIKFVKEEQLNENMLWRATKQIDKGKKLDKKEYIVEFRLQLYKSIHLMV